MHHVYTTPAFVIHSSPHGESGKFLLLFTRDFGMIGATAQGIRLIQSKLRYHIQDTSFSNVSIVRGKEIWRLTGAYGMEQENRTLLHIKILKLLKRLLHGEEKNDKLFEIIETLYLSKVDQSKHDIVECLTILRILNSLGYIKNTEELSMFLTSADLGDQIIEDFSKIKSKAIHIVNLGLKESQL